jgi:hypothetical protein
MVVRTYAPVGRTPILKGKLTRDHLSAMSAITLDGKLFTIEVGDLTNSAFSWKFALPQSATVTACEPVSLSSDNTSGNIRAPRSLRPNASAKSRK